jgi:hypothetical protein
MVMENRYNNFGELYRAAFAERDPEKKVELLGQVRRAIAEWEAIIEEQAGAGTEAGRKFPVSERTPARLSTVA